MVSKKTHVSPMGQLGTSRHPAVALSLTPSCFAWLLARYASRTMSGTPLLQLLNPLGRVTSLPLGEGMLEKIMTAMDNRADNWGRVIVLIH